MSTLLEIHFFSSPCVRVRDEGQWAITMTKFVWHGYSPSEFSVPIYVNKNSSNKSQAPSIPMSLVRTELTGLLKGQWFRKRKMNLDHRNLAVYIPLLIFTIEIKLNFNIHLWTQVIFSFKQNYIHEKKAITWNKSYTILATNLSSKWTKTADLSPTYTGRGKRTAFGARSFGFKFYLCLVTTASHFSSIDLFLYP